MRSGQERGTPKWESCPAKAPAAPQWRPRLDPARRQFPKPDFTAACCVEHRVCAAAPTAPNPESQLGGPAVRAGRGTGESGKREQLERLSAGAETTWPARRSLRNQRRSRRAAKDHSGGAAGSELAALLRALPAQRTGPSAAQEGRRLSDGAAVDIWTAEGGGSAARPGRMAPARPFQTSFG